MKQEVIALIRRRAPLIGAVLVAVVGLVAGANLVGDDGSRRHAARPAPQLALNLQPDVVRRLVVESGNRRVEIRQQGPGLWIPSEGGAENAAVLMTEVEDQLFPLQAYRTLAASPATPEYGLGTPEITLRVEDARRRWHAFAVGARTFTDGGSYVHEKGGGDRIYLVARAAVDGLRSLIRGEKFVSPRTPVEIQVEQERAEEVKRMQARKPGEPLPPLDTVWLRQALEAEGMYAGDQQP